jgi:hypothetical protein
MLQETDTEEQHHNSPAYPKDAKGRFLSGNIGGGRPKGSRNRLGEAFISDLERDWLQHGADAVAKVREADTSTYLRVVASILPKELNVTVSVLDTMSDDDLLVLLQGLRERRRQQQAKVIEASPVTSDK